MILKIEAQMTSKKRRAREKKEIKISLTFVDDIQKIPTNFAFMKFFTLNTFSLFTYYSES